MTPLEFKEIRKSLGLTQLALANALGYSKRTIQRIEAGDYEIIEKTKIALLLLRDKSLG